MERNNEEGRGMFRDETSGWLVAIGAMGVYFALFFGGNAVRCAVDGHWAAAGLLLLGALVGMAFGGGAAEEALRRRKAARRARDGRNEGDD